VEILDKLFKKIGIFPEYGISKLDFRTPTLNEIPEGLGKGIFIFCYQDGKIVSIRRAA